MAPYIWSSLQIDQITLNNENNPKFLKLNQYSEYLVKENFKKNSHLS